MSGSEVSISYSRKRVYSTRANDHVDPRALKLVPTSIRKASPASDMSPREAKVPEPGICGKQIRVVGVKVLRLSKLVVYLPHQSVREHTIITESVYDASQRCRPDQLEYLDHDCLRGVLAGGIAAGEGQRSLTVRFEYGFDVDLRHRNWFALFGTFCVVRPKQTCEHVGGGFNDLSKHLRLLQLRYIPARIKEQARIIPL